MTKTDHEKALVVFSGGLDSAVALFWAKKRYKTVETISFDYGQKHALELECAAVLAEKAEVSHRTVKSAISVETGLTARNQQVTDARSAFVPGRNLLFLVLSAQVAYVEGFKAVVTGFGAIEPGALGYPDTRPERVGPFCSALDLGINEEATVEYRHPFASYTKAQVVREAAALDCLDELQWTHTCFKGQYPPCGTCPACKLRADGFYWVGRQDPLLDPNNERSKKGPFLLKKGQKRGPTSKKSG